MPSPTWIRVVIGLAAAAMFALSALTGDTIDQKGLRWIGATTAGVTLLLLGFDRFAWRWPLVRKVTELGPTRVIHGTWRGTLTYEKDADGNPGSQPIYLVVKQTYSTIKLRCFFPSRGSESESVAATIEPDHTRFVVRYLFRTDTEYPDVDANRSTEGAARLRVVGRPANEMYGSYYVERNGGRGRMTFDGFSPKVVGSQHAAAQLSFRPLVPAGPAVSS